MAAVSIPVELQERILDWLHGDTFALKTCSLVCQAWKPTTRTHLFCTFKVRYDIESDEATSYCRDFVQQHLSLAGYIRELEIYDGCGLILQRSNFPASEPEALGVLLGHTHSLRKVVISTFCNGAGTPRRWESLLVNFRTSFRTALMKSSSTLTHILLDGFLLAVSDLAVFHGLAHLEYCGLERIGLAVDDELSSRSDDSKPPTLRALTLSFIFDDPAHSAFVRRVLEALHVVSITHLRLGGYIKASVLQALPPSWLSNVTHLGLELASINPANPASLLSPESIAGVPRFTALHVLDLSIILYASAALPNFSALEQFLTRLLPLPPHLLASLTTTVTSYGPPVYVAAVRRHYEYCRQHADETRLRWEDGEAAEDLSVYFPDLFAEERIEVGRFRTQKWISW